jgi:hypothetical protein
MAELTYFWDIDRPVLAGLSFPGRVEWLRQRIDRTLLQPLGLLEKAHTSLFVWLASTELICAGIQALGGFLGNTQFGEATPFCRFVHNFMHSDFSKCALDKDNSRITYCEHLQKYFRNGLDHGFVINWGGLWKANEPGFGGGYLRPNKDGNGIAVCPEMLLSDFRRAVGLYFDRLLSDGEQSVIGKNFTKRFESIMKQGDRN